MGMDPLQQEALREAVGEVAATVLGGVPVGPAARRRTPEQFESALRPLLS